MIPSPIKQFLFTQIFPRLAPCSIDDTIIVAGTGRSGTTWLSEMLRGLPGYRLMHEPFDPGRNPPAHRYGFQFLTYDRRFVAPGQRAPRLRKYLEEVLRGRIGPTVLWKFRSDDRLNMLMEFVRNRKLVVKFTRALRMLRWMSEEFNPRHVVVIIRHPCAVVRSMMNHGGWDPTRHEDRDFQARRVLLDPLPSRLRKAFASHLEEPLKPVEMMTHLWAIDYHVALIDQGLPSNATLVTYEELVADGPRVMDRLRASLGIRDGEDRLKSGLDVPADYASEDLDVSEKRLQLTRWKRELNPETIERILTITHRYELGFYGKDPEPDYGALAALSSHG